MIRNAVEAKRLYGIRGARAFIRNNWAPATYTSLRRRRRRIEGKAARLEWGYELSKAIASRDCRAIGQLLGDVPETATIPDKAHDTLRDEGYRCCYHDNCYYPSSEMVHLHREDVWVLRTNMEAAGVYTCTCCRNTFTASRGRIETLDTHVVYCGNVCAERSGCHRTEEGRWYSLEANMPPVYIYRYNQTFVGPIGGETTYPLGIELEIEFPRDDIRVEFAKKARDKYGREIAHCKHDGSLSSRGVEIVTGYGAYDELAPVVTDIAGLARSMGGTSHQTETCGQHVSVGRAQMSLAQQARFVVFFNHPANQAFLKVFARRRGSRYAATVPSKCDDHFIKRCEDDFDYLLGDKYEAVNCNHNTHLEVRIFRGSLNDNTILSRLALVHLVSEWVEQDLKAKNLLYSDFTKWMKSRGMDCEMFKNIEQYLKRRGKSDYILEEATC